MEHQLSLFYANSLDRYIDFNPDYLKICETPRTVFMTQGKALDKPCIRSQRYEYHIYSHNGSTETEKVFTGDLSSCQRKLETLDPYTTRGKFHFFDFFSETDKGDQE